MTEALRPPVQSVNKLAALDARPRELPALKAGRLRIRGHHLSSYILLASGRTPDEVAKKTTTSYRKNPLPHPLTPEEVRDMIGSTDEDFRRHEQGERELYEAFVAAPADFPLEYVENMPDDYCALSCIGAFCKTKGAKDTRGKTKDAHYLDVFLNMLRITHPDYLTDGTVRIDTEIATFSDAPPERVRVLRTTVGVFKELLEKWSFN